MPHHRTVKLRIGDHEITEITVALCLIEIPAHRRHYPGADSCMAIELPAVQQMMELIAGGQITPEQARDALEQLSRKLHETNGELRHWLELEESNWEPRR